MSIVFTGPDPESPNIAHAGGQLTATRGFAAFTAARGIRVDWVDTAQSNFPVPPPHIRLGRAWARVKRFGRLIKTPEARGAILFSGAGIGFLERTVMAWMAGRAGTPSLLMIRSGHFRTAYERQRWSQPLIRRLLRVPDKIGVQGQSWLPFLRELGVEDERIAIVPNWIADSHLVPAKGRAEPPRPPLRVLFAGWLTREKGVPELLDAIALLAQDRDDVHLTLAGGGTLLDEARQRADIAPLTGLAEVPGWLDREALRDALASHHLLVLPSHAEGFPNIVMEAMAAGMPVIATPVGAIADSVTDARNGFIVPVNNARAIATAIARYRDRPELLSEHSAEAIRTARERHDPVRNCTALIEALGLVVGDLPDTRR